MAMENSTSSGTTGSLQKWCAFRTVYDDDDLPVLLQASFIINSIINSILSIVTVIGNILILMSLKRTSRLHAASKALYCSLAVSDLGVGLFVQPAFVSRLITGREGLTHLCYLMEIIVNVVGVISVGVSLQTLSLISVDRVLAIRLKMRYKDVVTIVKTRVVLVMCWFFSTFHVVMIFASKAFFNLFQILGIIMCIGLSTVSYIIIFRDLRRLQNQIQNYGPGDETTRKASFNIQRYKKTVSTALWVYGSLIALYLPFMIGAATRMSVGPSATFDAIQWFGITLMYMNSALNPILYCWKIPEVRETLKEILKLYCSCIKSGNN